MPHLRPLWEAYAARHPQARFVEPFCGSLAVALGLRPAQALLNDQNPHLINFHRWLQRGLVIDLPMENDSRLYYQHRARFNELIAAGEAESSEAAALFYYLNRTGYNGLCRFNQRGLFNVPFGQYKQINYQRDFSGYAAILQAWTFSVGRFDSVALYEDDFIYADPPYDVEFTQYAKEGFSWADQLHLAEWLSGHSGAVALSNQATERVVRLYERLGFRLHYFDAPRRISSNGDRSPAREVLALRGIETSGEA